LKAVPLELKDATEFVRKNHRHNEPVYRDKFRCGCVDENGVLRGVVQVGRPKARALQDGRTVEIVRNCSDGYKNACSFLYARALRAAKALGYERAITYILESEDGASVKASGFIYEADVKGGRNWDCPSRPRNTIMPTCNKQRWVKYLNK
jgi:hypothetical protein